MMKGSIKYQVRNNTQNGFVIDYKIVDQSQKKRSEGSYNQSQQFYITMRAESEDAKQFIREDDIFFSQFRNPLYFQKDKGIESIIPISIPNNEINFMISSNNDFVFISPGYVKGLNNEQYNEMFEKIVCSS